MCSELDRWYKYVKEKKGDKYALVLAKIFQYLFMQQKKNPQKPPTKVKRIREEMQTTLENRKNVAINFPKNAPKTKNEVEEGGALSSGVKMEHENIDVKG